MKNKKIIPIFGMVLGVLLLAGIIFFISTHVTKQSKTELEFSKGSGFYKDEIQLELTSNQKGSTIYYTTDGSTPTEQSAKYDKPLTIKDRSSEPNDISMKTGISFVGDFTPSEPIQKATVVRAFVKFKDGTVSPVITNTYFIGKEFADKYKNINVVSLSIDPDSFYSNETGIYVKGKVYDDWVKNGGDVENTPEWELPGNFTQSGREWERNVIMIKRYLLEEGTESDMNLYEDMISFARDNDLSDESNYEKISDMVDIQSLIDYFVTEIYIVNGDWLNHENNWRIWRSRTTSGKPYEDGKWRYMLYDSEYSMGVYSQGKDYNVNSLKDAMTLPDDPEIPGTQITLFTSLMKNADFQKQFTNTFMDMVNQNFKLERMNELLDKSIAEYEPFMEDYYARFGSTHPQPIMPNPVSAFYTSIDELKLFLNNRNDYIPTMLKDTLKLKGEAVELNVSVNDPNAGSVTINTIKPDFSNGAFTGKYFTDYEVTLTANEKDGYTFTGWSGDTTSTTPTIQLKPGEVLHIQAQFEKK